MEYEIELKLITPAQAGELIESQLLPQLALNTEQQEFELTNRYYDTADRDFRKNGMGLRIRGCQGEFEQTIKTAGSTVAGLQQRPEYNIALPSSTEPQWPDLSLFPATIWPVGFAVDKAQSALQCLFTTHFTRTAYCLTLDKQSQIELVWDRGWVNSDGQTESINELELELKQGDICQLFEVARLLAKLMPVKIGLLSKAARGYRLLNRQAQADKQPSKPLSLLSEDDIKHTSLTQLRSLVAKHLSAWQKLVTQFEQQTSEGVWQQISQIWQQLTLLLAQCCRLEPLNSALIVSAMQDYQQDWHSLELSETAMPVNWHDAFEVLSGKTAFLMQLAIMQYLVEQQSN